MKDKIPPPPTLPPLTITQLLYFFSKITDLLIRMSVKFKFKLISRYSSWYSIRLLTESVG